MGLPLAVAVVFSRTTDARPRASRNDVAGPRRAKRRRSPRGLTRNETGHRDHQALQARRGARGADRQGRDGDDGEEAKGFGRQKGHSYARLTSDDDVAFVPKLMVEVVVDDDVADEVVDIVRIAAFTGRIGDGKIFVQEVVSAPRIRTGETGSEAL